MVMVQAIPGPVILTMAVRLAGMPDLPQHTLEATILDAAMQLTGDPLATTFSGEAGPNAAEGWEIGMVVPLVMQFQAVVEGAYTVNVAVDGNSESITVRVGTVQPTA